MKRHFKENFYIGDSALELHQYLLNKSAFVADNIACELHDSKVREKPKYVRMLAESAYDLIAVCEAIIASTPDDVAKRAKDTVTKLVKPAKSVNDLKDKVDILREELVGDKGISVNKGGDGIVDISGSVSKDSELGRAIDSLFDTVFGGGSDADD